MNYHLNVSLIGSSTKNDRCQDVTLSFERNSYRGSPNQSRLILFRWKYDLIKQIWLLYPSESISVQNKIITMSSGRTKNSVLV